jgi:hypothetical protein
VCNVRLRDYVLAKGLAGSLVLRKNVEKSGFHRWAPSPLPPLEGTPKVPGKVVADVAEALIGACLLDGGPVAADAFLQWLGFPTACKPQCVCPHQPPPEAAAWPIRHRDCHCWWVGVHVRVRQCSPFLPV